MAGDEPTGVLRADYFRLRPLGTDDMDFYCSLYTDDEVLRYVGPSLSLDRAQRAFLAAMKQVFATPPKARYWVLLEHGSEVPSGLLAMVYDGHDRAAAELGMLLTSRAQGKGYATRAISALADEVFASAGFTRLWARHSPDNPAAAGLMRTLGFKRAGIPVDTGPQGWGWQLERCDWLGRETPPRQSFALLPKKS